MKFFNLSLALVLSSALVACEAKRNPYFENEEDAQFKVNGVSLVKAQNTGWDSSNKPNKKMLNLSACITDLMGAAVPPRLKFKIQLGKQVLNRTTNRDGCLEWGQEIGFNRRAPSKYYKMTITFIGQSELGGRYNVEIAVDPKEADVLDLSKRNNKRLEGVELETYEPEGFAIPNITKNAMIPSEPEVLNGEVIPNSNVIPNQGPASITMNIASAELRRLQLNQDEPYSINENLDLSVQYTYEFSTTPRYFIKSFDSNETEEIPSTGNYKVSLAIIEEPEFSVTKIWEELNRSPDLKTLANSASITTEALALKIAAKSMMSNGNNQMLTNIIKRKLMAKALLPHVQQTATFTTKMTTQFGLTQEITMSLKKLALLETRALMAVTVQPLDSDIGANVKADGAGYIASIGNPGSVKIQPWPIEADLLHAERLQAESQKVKLKPLENFFYKSNNADGDKAFKPLDLTDIPRNAAPNAIGKAYSIKDNLETYLADGFKNKYDKLKFEMSFCYKLFNSPQMQNLSASRRHVLINSCTQTPEVYLNIQQLEFVEKVLDTKAVREGHTINIPITISRGFSYGRQEGANWGSKFDASIALSGNISGGLKTPDLKGLGDKASLGAGLGLNLAAGNTWYYSYGVSVSQGVSSGVSTNMSINFNAELNQFRLNLETRRCTIVSFNDTIKKFLEKNKAEPNKGFVVCSNKTVPNSYLESYYIIAQDCRSSIRDCTSGREGLLRMMVRGREFFAYFENVLKQTDLKMVLQKIPQDALRAQVRSWSTDIDSFLTSQIFPGAIAH